MAVIFAIRFVKYICLLLNINFQKGFERGKIMPVSVIIICAVISITCIFVGVACEILVRTVNHIVKIINKVDAIPDK